MRFEAKHSFFKKVVHDTRNWKNVQMMAYHLDSGFLFKQKLYVENVKVARLTQLDPALRHGIQKKYPHLDIVSLSEVIQLDGTKYAAGMIVPAGQCSGLPDFHKIETIVNDAEKVAFICKRTHMCRLSCSGSSYVDRLSSPSSIHSWWKAYGDPEGLHFPVK